MTTTVMITAVCDWQLFQASLTSDLKMDSDQPDTKHPSSAVSIAENFVLR